jgi:hypothetical protein
VHWGDPAFSALLAAGYLGLVTVVWALLATSLPGWARRWRVERSAPADAKLLRVSVVVPVRDEAAWVADCLVAVLASDPPAFEVVVVDDGSEDETWDVVAAIAAADPRVRLVEGTEPPRGWAGKPWACQRGAGEAAGEIVLFLDADVRLSPWALGEAAWRLDERGLDLLSWVGDTDFPDPWSRAVGPLVDWFLRGTVDLEAANDRGRPEGIARGSFLMVRHSAYDEVGGHGPASAHLLDDVALARAFKQRARHCGFSHAPGAYRVVQRHGLAGVLSRGRRRLYESLGRSPLLAGGVVLFVLIGMVAPFLLLLGGLVARFALGWAIASWVWLAWLAAICALVIAFRWRIEQLDGRSGHQAALQPLSALVFASLLIASTFQVETRWRRRDYVDGRACSTDPK